MGIPKKNQKLMFSRFFRASNAVGILGTGLGLNIAQHYVRSLNGTIDFINVQEKGKTFTFCCPPS
ncbi:ATP-binding protein [Arenibacter sp. TNZ]|uniref:ATP-binding protein n=1 Tax=Arenibacter TaxID=178469 RepID=UPI000CD3BDF0|nr:MULTISPECIES: sensor histidine kinase [Arenibacter]MCM4173969.1 ATP-binding protein [Arenibacter sp. TNZ]